MPVSAEKQLKLYERFGFAESGTVDNQIYGSCPWCHKDKFYFNPEREQWDCKVCGESGNLTSFLWAAHRLARKPSPADIKAIIKRRPGLDKDTITKAKIVHDAKHGAYLLPVFKPGTDKVTTFRSWGSNNVMYNMPEPCKPALYYAHHVPDSHLFYITEGEWDALALARFCRAAKHAANVIASPGSSGFSPRTAPASLLKGRDLVFFYDNDDAGRKGMAKAVEHAAKCKTASIATIHWPKKTPDKYDVRDYLVEHLTGKPGRLSRAYASTVLDKLLNLTAPPQTDPTKTSQTPTQNNPTQSSRSSTKGRASLPGNIGEAVAWEDEELRLPERVYNSSHTFNSLAKKFSTQFGWRDRENRALALTIAATGCVYLKDGDPVWLHLVGNSGCGKTLLIDCFKGLPTGVYRSSIHAKALVSGWFTKKSGEEGVLVDNTSLLVKLNRRTLFIKDWTEILSQSHESQTDIDRVLRGGFDGYLNMSYGTGKTISCETDIGIVTGVTHAIHGRNEADKGERFLKYQFSETSRKSRRELAISAFNFNGVVDKKLPKAVCEFTYSVISKILHKPPKVRFSKSLVTRLTYLAELTGYLRSYVPDAAKATFHSFTIEPEMASRLTRQFKRLIQVLTVVRNCTVNQAYEDIEYVAWDTCQSHRRDIFEYFIRAKYWTRETILTEEKKKEFGIQLSAIQRQLDALVVLGLLKVSHLAKGGKDRRGEAVYTLATNGEEIVKGAKLSILKPLGTQPDKRLLPKYQLIKEKDVKKPTKKLPKKVKK